MAVCMTFSAPLLDFSELGLGPCYADLVPSAIDVTAVSIDGNPVAPRDRCAGKLRAVGCDSTVMPLHPTTQGFPIWRATSAAWAVRAPTAVTMPAATAKPATSAVLVSGRIKIAGSPAAVTLGALGIERGASHGDAAGRAYPCDHRISGSANGF